MVDLLYSRKRGTLQLVGGSALALAGLAGLIFAHNSYHWTILSVTLGFGVFLANLGYRDLQHLARVKRRFAAVLDDLERRAELEAVFENVDLLTGEVIPPTNQDDGDA
jgi:hypothetical protein